MIGIVLAMALAAVPPQAQGAAEAESRLAMQAFAQCVVNKQPDAAASLLSMDYRDKAYQQAIRRMAQNNGGCIGLYKSAQFNSLVFAGALAEQLIVRERTDIARAIAFDPGRPVLPSRGPSETLALCLALEQPKAVAGLLQTPLASDEESAAFAAVVAGVPACLPTGQPLRTNRAGLRAILATASYRIIRASASSAAAAGGQ